MKKKCLFVLLFFFGIHYAGIGQDIVIDSIPHFIKKHYYTNFDDNTRIVWSDKYGHNQLIKFINQDSIYHSIKGAIINNENCTRLNLYGRTTSNYCDDIVFLNGLEYINLSSLKTSPWNYYTNELPKVVYDQSKLKVFIADNSNIRWISYQIQGLSELEILSLSDGKMVGIPDEIGKLNKLQVLDLSFNRITNLPSNFNKLSNLKYLNLAGNKLKFSCNKELSSLKRLEFLSIQYDNHIYGDINNTILALTMLPELKVVHLRYSHLKQLPEGFRKFKHLEQLSLKGNYDLDLAQAFEVLSCIKSLKVLDLSYCRITELPREIGLLIDVETLYLGGDEYYSSMRTFYETSPNNDIKKLPNEISKMQSLRFLYLWGSDISKKQKEAIRSLLPNTHIEFDFK